MSSEKPTTFEMWWPAPSALADLTVEETEKGFALSAPDNTECADWLAYWSASEEHEKVFNEAFVGALQAYLLTLEKLDE